MTGNEILSIDPPTAMVVKDIGALVDMVSQGFDMGMMMDFMLQEGFASGEADPRPQAALVSCSNDLNVESKQSLKIRSLLAFMSALFS